MIHIVFFDVEFANQKFEHLRVDVIGHLKSNRWAKAASQQFFFERLKQVFTLVFVDLEVFVAGHPKGVVLQHLHARKELPQELPNDFFERQVAR